MRRVFAGIPSILASVILSGSLAIANEPKGGPPDYSGISSLYYTIIFIILAYGVYDTFFKRS